MQQCGMNFACSLGIEADSLPASYLQEPAIFYDGGVTFWAVASVGGLFTA